MHPIDFIRNLSDRVNLKQRRHYSSILRQRSFSFVVPITEHLPLNSKLDYKYQNDSQIFWQGLFNSHRRYVQIQAKHPREICYLIATTEDIFTRMNIDYNFLCNSSSVAGSENHKDKSSSVENHQDTVGDTENR